MKNILHIMLLVSVLLSSMSFVLDRHYCNNELKSTSFFLKARNCHDQQTAACPMHTSKDAQEDKNCCDNESELIKVDIDQNFHPTVYKDLDFKVLVSILWFFAEPSETEEKESISKIKNWNPPPPSDVYLPLHQSFLC